MTLTYSHQEEALKLAQKGNNIVVTTGTGSGKTECFLLPIINHLLEELHSGTLTNAVRAIIIYPMNALANDQMKRLRRIFDSCPEITFGLYIGNTRHQQKAALADYRNLHRCDPIINEKISREVMQNEPPHILITNYSMLEYMMLRPKDDAVFSGADLRFLVLDEAHVYRGATGMETAVLMRRLRARISTPKNVQYILTSATLGGKDADDDIVAFAEQLCSATFHAKNIIRFIEVRQPMVDYHEFPTELFSELNDENNAIVDVLAKHGADFAPAGDESEKLFELLLRSDLFSKLRDAAIGTKTLGKLAKEIGVSKETLVHLIAVSAGAIKNDTSLVKARYHFFLRALEGVFVTLTGSRDLYLSRKEYDDHDNPVFECALCDDCGRVALAGKQIEKYLVHPKSNFDDSADYYLIKQKDEADFFDEDEDSEKPEKESGKDENDYILCPTCGAMELEKTAKKNPMCDHSINQYTRVRKSVIRKSGYAACPACEFGNFRRFYLGYEAVTAVLGTALYYQLPEYETIPVPVSEKQTEETGFFSVSKVKQPSRVNKARQFLAFSDSRSDAAFFASYMEISYKEFLRRRGLWQICDKMLDEGRSVISASEAIAALARLFESSNSFVEIGKERESQIDNCRKEAYIAILNELASSKRSSGLVQLGRVSFLYSPKNPARYTLWEDAIKKVANHIPDSENAMRDATALMNLLILDVIYNGALDAGDEFSLNADEREYLFYAPMAKKIMKIKNKGARGYIAGWIPRQRTGESKSYYYSTRMFRVMRSMGLKDNDAWSLLSDIWKQILGFEDEKEYALPIQDFDIVIHGPSNRESLFNLYRCERCSRITAFNCQDKCTNVKCIGILKEFDPSSSNASNHYVNLYSIPDMNPFYIKEHTAQLSRERGAEYQKLFIDKKINALSSSTTFEMGVDVGTLETVFLRNIPPTPANYVQRAGRAGRSLKSAAYALTYAKLSSHDFTYFGNPEDMISGLIRAPIFRLENEKIIRRHINAVALSAFFKIHDDVYDKDNQSELLNSGGYEKLKEFLSSRPDNLRKLLIDSIPSGNFGINDWQWTEHLVGDNGILEVAVQDFKDTVAYLESDRNRCQSEENYEAAAAVDRKLRNYRADKEKDKVKGFSPRRSLIDFLVRNNILPKYGFPVDTVELLPDPISIRDANRPQMQRDLQIAVAEYAPGSEIVADGKLYTSRYIHKSPSKGAHNWEYGWYATCFNKGCEADNFYSDSSSRDDLACRSCGQEIGKPFWQKTLEPRRGFIAGNSDNDRPKAVKMQKPDKNYKTDDVYIGNPISRKIIDKRGFSVDGNLIQIESTANDSLVVRTQTKFRVCLSCGYATGKGEVYNKKHSTAFGGKCPNENAGVEYFLTHEFKTDVARITFEISEATDYSCMMSVLFALLESMVKELDIERNDIKGCLYRARLDAGTLVWSLVIYDAVAGGAGHSRRLVTPDGMVLSKVFARAVKLIDVCDCEPSCYKCLRNYYNQKLHDQLNRTSAANFLRGFIGKVDTVDLVDKEFDTRNDSNVTIIDSTPLKGDYSCWNEAAFLFTHIDGLVSELETHRVPLADAFEVQLRMGERTIDAVLVWETEKIIIFDSITGDEQNILAGSGWRGCDFDNLNIVELKERLGVV